MPISPLDLFDAWIEALRSGKYEQVREKLNEQDMAFCCLGVLCEVAIAKGFPLVKNDKIAYVTYNGVMDLPPAEISDFLGISEAVNPDDPQRYLSGKNDLGAPFSEIADIIERNYEDWATRSEGTGGAECHSLDLDVISVG